MTHSTPEMSVRRPAVMAGMAVETIVASTRIMKKPSTRAHRARHACGSVPPRLSAVV